jgi:hypothetical protein
LLFRAHRAPTCRPTHLFRAKTPIRLLLEAAKGMVCVHNCRIVVLRLLLSQHASTMNAFFSLEQRLMRIAYRCPLHTGRDDTWRLPRESRQWHDARKLCRRWQVSQSLACVCLPRAACMSCMHASLPFAPSPLSLSLPTRDLAVVKWLAEEGHGSARAVN